VASCGVLRPIVGPLLAVGLQAMFRSEQPDRRPSADTHPGTLVGKKELGAANSAPTPSLVVSGWVQGPQTAWGDQGCAA